MAADGRLPAEHPAGDEAEAEAAAEVPTPRAQARPRRPAEIEHRLGRPAYQALQHWWQHQALQQQRLGLAGQLEVPCSGAEVVVAKGLDDLRQVALAAIANATLSEISLRT